MNNQKHSKYELSEFLTYLASMSCVDGQRIPSLNELSQTLGISVSTLREQLEVARIFGLVEIKPKAGIRKLPYDFRPVVSASLTYAIESKSVAFEQFSDFRKHLESAYFVEAAQLLTTKDIDELSNLVLSAQKKISGIPGQNPVIEHREFHTRIYKHINNEFLSGIFECYWDLYRIEGLEIYSDLNYIEKVWQYHARILEQIKSGNFNQGLKYLLEHMEMINQREKVLPRLSFE